MPVHKSQSNTAALHKNEQDLEETLEIVCHFYVRGYTHLAISDEIKRAKGIRPSLNTIGWYVKKLKERWRKDEKAEREEYVRLTLAKIDNMEAEAWRAWERSKEDEQSVTTEKAVPKELKEAVDKAARREGKRKKEGGEMKLETIKEVIRTTGRLPHAGFLNIVAVCIQMRRELLGLDAPKEVEVKGSVQGKVRMDWAVRAKALPPVEQVEAEIERVRVLAEAETVECEIVDKG